jgi:hypothetical protein
VRRDGSAGVWIELTWDKQTQASAAERFNLLIPGSQILTIIVVEQFLTAIRQEARKIGFTWRDRTGMSRTRPGPRSRF